MAIVKLFRKDPRCSKHDTPVTITVPTKKIGNAHGEEWYCEKCKGSPDEINIRV